MPTGKQDTARPPLARLVVFDELSGRKQKMSPSLVVSTDRTLVVPPPHPLSHFFFSSYQMRSVANALVSNIRQPAAGFSPPVSFPFFVFALLYSHFIWLWSLQAEYEIETDKWGKCVFR